MPLERSLDIDTTAEEECVVPHELPIVKVSPWSHSRAKRIIDLVGASILLLPALPLMAVVAIAVKLTSQGPVLFRQSRCGKNGDRFQLLKFRSMHHAPNGTGLRLTSSKDTRITPVGRVIRKWKLDELPQLLNVIRGEMSLVGPRPDLPEYLDALPAERRQVLRLKPGITSIATLRFRNEEDLLSSFPAEEVTAYYMANILPKKVDMELAYARRASFFSDVAVLLRTSGAIFR